MRQVFDFAHTVKAAYQRVQSRLDTRILELARDGKTKRFKAKRDKGHESEIRLTLEAQRQGNPAPIPLEELEEVSAATIAIEEATGAEKIALPPATHAPAV